MGRNQDWREPKDGRPRVGIGQFFVIVGMAVLLFLLAQTMVRHRFFRGGGQDNRMERIRP